MPKIGRNDPCPCGSGKKYKHCCRDKDEAAERAAFVAARAAAAAEYQERQARLKERQARLEHEDELARASNAVIDLLDAGKVDEAEQAARELLVRFPDVHDGYDRLGIVYEAREDYKRAADCYRKVIEFVRAHPELYEPEFEITFQRLIAKLDPPAAPG
jgi:tetratricopeptide (TPR) repeat protein